MLTKIKKNILSEYNQKSALYAAYGQKLQHLIQEILTEANISFHSVSFRCKEKISLEKKLGKQGVAYKCLSDITDICGIRIITYFDDEVKKVSKLLEAEFHIDKLNSSDKSESLDPDRFGYLSVHYVISNGEERNKLTEYKRFSEIKAEIQVRSILQHAWAEIEHDLGYKSPQGIPKAVRRRFSRLAGLLELADQEFYTIREELSNYSNEVLVTIESSPADVELNAISLGTLIAKSDLITRLDLIIADSNKSEIYDSGLNDYDKEVRKLMFFEIDSIDKVSNLLLEHENILLRFAQAWLNRFPNEEGGSFSPGICLFYLCYVLIIQTSDTARMTNYLKQFVAANDEETYEQLANELIDVYRNLDEQYRIK